VHRLRRVERRAGDVRMIAGRRRGGDVDLREAVRGAEVGRRVDAGVTDLPRAAARARGDVDVLLQVAVDVLARAGAGDGAAVADDDLVGAGLDLAVRERELVVRGDAAPQRHARGVVDLQ